MTFSITYKPLFEVKILHHYFLDKGNTNFFSMNEEQRKKQLADFDISSVFAIIPSVMTQRKLAGLQMVVKNTGNGFTVWVRVSEESDNTPLISLNDTLELTFLLKLVNHTFFNFTNIDITNAGKLFFFSNKQPESEAPNFPLIKNSNQNQAIDDKYALSNAGKLAEFGPLTNTEKDNLFGLIRIYMRGDKASLHVTTNQQLINDPHRKFQLVFGNRKTLWRYYFSEDQQVKGQDDVKKENGNARQLVTKSLQPLTQKGFVSIELGGVELPNPDATLVKPDSANDKIYSEIYM